MDEIVFIIFVSVKANIRNLNICDEISIKDNKSLNLETIVQHFLYTLYKEETPPFFQVMLKKGQVKFQNIFCFIFSKSLYSRLYSYTGCIKKSRQIWNHHQIRNNLSFGKLFYVHVI